MTTADLLLHPVRLRIVQCFLGDRRLTTGELREELADVAPATLYRQVGTLAEAGVLHVVAERKVRGTYERTYRMEPGAASLGPDEAATMSVEDHRRAFLAFVAGLLADFDRYLDAAPDDVDLGRDQVGYRQVGMHLTDDEHAALLADLRSVVAARAAQPPTPGRRRRILTTIVL